MNPSPTTTTPSQHKPYTAPTKQIWGWAVGRIAEFGLIGTFGQAMNIFTIGFGLSPVVVSWCMMLPRVVDGILDPIIGHWSDDTHTRWGRRKPFLIGGAFVGAIFLAILWWANPAWSSTAQFLYLGLIGMCLYLCYGTYAMAWNAVGFELSDDYHERAKVQAIGGFVLAIMLLQGSWTYWFALRPMFGSVIVGMRWIGGTMAVLVIISAIITAKMTKERFTHTNRKHVPIGPALKMAIKNRPFRYLLLMRIFEILGSRLSGGLAFYIGVYYVCRGDQDLATKIGGIGATLGTIWNFVALPLVKPASQWIGKRGALIAGAAVGFAAAVVAPFITTPAHPYWQMLPSVIFAPLLVISSTLAGAITPDICDVDELETGQRREGLFTAVQGFIGKLEISLAVIMVGYIVTWAHVDTKIGHRWEGLLADKSSAFPVGETAVFELNLTKVNAVTLTGEGLEKYELLVGNESPTTGFRTVGQSESFLARYLKIRLVDGKDITLHKLRIGDQPHPRLVAAQPSERIQKNLFWIVMSIGIVFTFLTLLMAILFPLTEAQMKEVRRQLDERHHAHPETAPDDETQEKK